MCDGLIVLSLVIECVHVSVFVKMHFHRQKTLYQCLLTIIWLKNCNFSSSFKDADIAPAVTHWLHFLISWNKYRLMSRRCTVFRWFTHNKQTEGQKQTQDQMADHLSVCSLLNLLHSGQLTVCGLASAPTLACRWQKKASFNKPLTKQRHPESGVYYEHAKI